MKIVRKVKGKRISLRLFKASEAIPEKGWVEAMTFKICLNDRKHTEVGECMARIGMNEALYYSGHIGFHVDEPYRGNGYAGEAVELMKKVYLKNGYHSVIITNDPNNHASVRVCEKLGCKLKEVAPVPTWHDLYKQGHAYENIWILDF